MTTIRGVCIFTGSRADYGPLRPVISAVANDRELDLSIIASGGHLIAQQGSTVDQIEADGFQVDETIDMVLASDNAVGVAKSFGLGMIGYADSIRRISPEILVVLGDRYEALAITICATLQRIPVAHIAGGEVTKGSIDDPIRNAITQLSSLHFVATEMARDRVVSMGAARWSVHNTGSPSIDTIKNLQFLPRDQLFASLEIQPKKDIFLITYHPVTADPHSGRAGIIGLVEALQKFPNVTSIFTESNIDDGGSEISELIHRFVSTNPEHAVLVKSLGQESYLSLLHASTAVIGNSSSGLSEAPALQTPTVNIGPRQSGRPRADSVIDCGTDAAEIEHAIRRATSPSNADILSRTKSPYGIGNAAKEIVSKLRSTDLSKLQRSFNIE
ncbi:UDP-N-acetylglucosamine 2-epimerase [Prauserella marina]|uniref:UDP-N-acetylglucosamine 2-epimerase n=1 Tax=Prauserella marina TaxID=530584 RepID=UPI00147502C7|nr:UDP-N-acetylglucosamine 2-epimerase [Prauserella marina]